jgi:hypothetical protein
MRKKIISINNRLLKSRLQWLSKFAEYTEDVNFDFDAWGEENNLQYIKDIVHDFINIVANTTELLSQKHIMLLKKLNQEMTAFSTYAHFYFGASFLRLGPGVEEADNIFAIGHELFHAVIFIVNRELQIDEKWDYPLHLEWHQKNIIDHEAKNELLADMFGLGLLSVVSESQLENITKSITKHGCNYEDYSHREYYQNLDDEIILSTWKDIIKKGLDLYYENPEISFSEFETMLAIRD